MTLREWAQGKGTNEEAREFFEQECARMMKRKEERRKKIEQEEKNKLTEKEVEQIEDAVLMFD